VGHDFYRTRNLWFAADYSFAGAAAAGSVFPVVEKHLTNGMRLLLVERMTTNRGGGWWPTWQLQRAAGHHGIATFRAHDVQGHPIGRRTTKGLEIMAARTIATKCAGGAPDAAEFRR